MDFIAEDYDTLPIILAKFLASDFETAGGAWHVDLLNVDGEELAAGYLYPTTDSRFAMLSPEQPGEVGWETPRAIPWAEVGTIKL